MSLCDTCKDPGACCREMYFWGATSQNQLVHWKDEDPVADLTSKIGPHLFVPGEPFGEWQDENGRAYVGFSWSCSALGPDGRCTVYQDRPQLCRDYEPASTPLCVHYVPATEPTE